MHKRLRVVLAMCAIVVAAQTPAQQPAPDKVAATAEEIVANFRRMIVLHEAAGRSRDLTQAGQYLFFRNRQLASQLVADLLAPPDSDKRITALLDLIERQKLLLAAHTLRERMQTANFIRFMKLTFAGLKTKLSFFDLIMVDASWISNSPLGFEKSIVRTRRGSSS